jgi:hypothetical protein
MTKILKVLIVGAALLAAPLLQAQPFGPFTGSLGSTNIAAQTAVNLTSNTVPLYRNRGIALWIPMSASANTANSVTNVLVTTQVSMDTVNWMGDQVFTVGVNGTTPINLYTNWPAGGWSTTLPPIDNMAYFRVKSISWTGLGTLYVSNINWSVFP